MSDKPPPPPPPLTPIHTHTHTVHRAQSTGSSQPKDDKKGKVLSLSHSLFDSDSMDESEDLFSPKLTKPEQVGEYVTSAATIWECLCHMSQSFMSRYITCHDII